MFRAYSLGNYLHPIGALNVDVLLKKTNCFDKQFDFIRYRCILGQKTNTFLFVYMYNRLFRSTFFLFSTPCPRPCKIMMKGTVQLLVLTEVS